VRREKANHVDKVAFGCLDDLVTARRYASPIATLLVAICVALAVPVSQLRMSYVTVECCCPDAARCHCPDQKPDPSKCPAMRTCHKWEHVTTIPSPPAFARSEAVVAIVQPRVIRVERSVPSVPSPSPRFEEPYGPS
jgi:hypothetical protein